MTSTKPRHTITAGEGKAPTTATPQAPGEDGQPTSPDTRCSQPVTGPTVDKALGNLFVINLGLTLGRHAGRVDPFGWGLGSAGSVFTTKRTQTPRGPQVEGHVTALFGMPGFELLGQQLVDGEWQLLVQTVRDLVGCPTCGAVAAVKDRRTVRVRDLPISGVPVQICWRKRIFACRHPLCEQKTWTETSEAIPAAVGDDRPGPPVGVRAGRPARLVRRRGRRRVGRRLAHDHAGGPPPRRTARSPTSPPRRSGRGRRRRGDRGRRGRDRVPAGHRVAPDDVRHRHRRPHPGPPGAAPRRRPGPLRHRPRRLAGRTRPEVAQPDPHRLAGSVPRLRHRPGHPAAGRDAGPRPVSRRASWA